MSVLQLLGDGGVWVLPVLASGVVMGALTAVLALLSFTTVRIPAAAMVAGAAVTVALGVLGVHMGVRGTVAAVATAPPEMTQTLAVGGTSIALIPLWVAFSLAAPAVTLSSVAVAASSRTARWAETTSDPTRAWIVLAVGLVGAALAAGVVLLVSDGRAWGGPALSVAVGAAALAVAAGRGSTDAVEGPSLAALQARVAALAIVGASLSLGAAWCWHMMEALRFGAVAPPELFWAAGASVLATPGWLALGAAIGVVGLAVAGALTVWPSRQRLATPRSLAGLLALLAVVGMMVLPPLATVGPAVANAKEQAVLSARGFGEVTVPVVHGEARLVYSGSLAANPVIVLDRGVRIGLESFEHGGEVEAAVRDARREQAEIYQATGLQEAQPSARVWLVAPASAPWSQVGPVLAAFGRTWDDLPHREVHIAVHDPGEGLWGADLWGSVVWCWSADGSGFRPPEDATWQEVVDGLRERGDGCLELGEG